MIRVGIIETGRPYNELVEKHGDFPRMFQTYFSPLGKAQYSVYAVTGGAALPHPNDCDAWIITGSPSAVYEDHAWLPPLRKFVLAAVAKSVPTLGVCFGHQLMAQAMGGVVAKSDKGRGIGIHEYELTEAGQKIIPGAKKVSLIAAHQDQVIQPPPDATVLASSAFCSYAAFSYGDCALSLQSHPEFTKDCIRDIICMWQKQAPVQDNVIARALGTLEAMSYDSERMAPIIWNFLTRQLVAQQ